MNPLDPEVRGCCSSPPPVLVSTSEKSWESALPKDQVYRDLTYEAVWSLSSCKAEGFGISQLLHPSVENYWQSDGAQPHTITIEFQKKTDVQYLLLYLDSKIDESYTPSMIKVYKGNSIHDLDNGSVVQFADPTGWVRVDLREKIRGKKNSTLTSSRVFCLQIHVVQNHQNGRDTHIRGAKVVGPGQQSSIYDLPLALASSDMGNELAENAANTILGNDITNAISFHNLLKGGAIR